MKKAGVSVVIPSFNNRYQLFRLLNSLKKSNYQNFEVVVVDNGSKDKTLIDGRKKYKWVKWVDAGSVNIGQTGCYNLGFAYARKINHILYCDADVKVDREMIRRLVEVAESSPKIGIVTPMILYLSDKNFVHQAGAEVNLTTGRVIVNWGPRKNLLQSRIVQNSGTAMLIKRAVINKIGGFEDWFLCYFDADFCLRAKKAGFITWYEANAFCFHDQSKDPNIWRPRVLTRAYLLGRNRVLFMRRHGNMLTFSIFLLALWGYYFWESLKFKQMKKFIELLRGSIVGYFYPLSSANFVPLPKI